jgi:hypothetical protein
VIETAPKRGYVLAGAAVLTAAGLAGALWLGSWAFDVRRYTAHNGRLERLLAKKPVLDLVVQALEEEGTPLLAQADSEADLLAVAESLGGDKQAEVVVKGKRWPRTRVFRAVDMRYFIYFDAEGVMRGFTCVGG